MKHLASWLPMRLIRADSGAGQRGSPDPAARIVAGLPPYQIAFWPDGWMFGPNGDVLVRDTHAMAEARRWYAIADRASVELRMDRTMRLYGTFVPRSIVALAGQRFPTEAVASVAVQLVARDWIAQRREHLLAAPGEAVRLMGLGWSGSRYEADLDADSLAACVRSLLDECAREGLIPKASYGLRLRAEDGFGLRGYRCLITTGLECYAAARAREAIQAALVPWNRAVVRDGGAHVLIKVEMRCPGKP
jgi:hypothetical protein